MEACSRKRPSVEPTIPTATERERERAKETDRERERGRERERESDRGREKDAESEVPM